MRSSEPSSSARGSVGMATLPHGSVGEELTRNSAAYGAALFAGLSQLPEPFVTAAPQSLTRHLNLPPLVTQTPESPLSPLTPDPLPTPLALAQPSPAGRGSVVGMETLPRGPIADDAHNRAADEDRGKAPVEAKGEKGEPDGLDARDRVIINGLVGDLYVTVPKDDEWTELDDMLFEASAFLKEVKPA